MTTESPPPLSVIDCYCGLINACGQLLGDDENDDVKED